MHAPTLAKALAVTLLVTGYSLTTSAAPGEMVKLSDKKGREIEAKILLVVGDEVEIEMAGGRKHTLPIDRFSLSSQELIRSQADGGKPDTAAAPPTDFDDDPIFAFTDLEFKEKKLDHFLIRTIGTKFDPADDHAEDVFKIMAETIPTLPQIFENQQFCAPGKQPNIHDFPEPDKRFRHEIYLVEDSGDYNSLLTQYSVNYPDGANRQNFLQSAGQVGSFKDTNHRLTVIRKEDGQPKETLLAHILGVQMVGARIARPNTPFWLTMGAGYYAEHKKFKKCTVYYVDFNGYYEESGAGGAGQMTKSETLSNSEPWPKPTKELCKNGKRVNLDRLFKVTTAELTPNDSAYALALYCYLNSTPEMTVKFNQILDQIKSGTTIDPQGIADLFGYATPEEFEEAWYAYIMSSDFK